MERALFADKVVKVPSKRGPEALRRILNDYEANANGKEFVEYYKEKGEKYFYDFLNRFTRRYQFNARRFY